MLICPQRDVVTFILSFSDCFLHEMEKGESFWSALILFDWNRACGQSIWTAYEYKHYFSQIWRKKIQDQSLKKS